MMAAANDQGHKSPRKRRRSSAVADERREDLDAFLLARGVRPVRQDRVKPLPAGDRHRAIAGRLAHAGIAGGERAEELVGRGPHVGRLGADEADLHPVGEDTLPVRRSIGPVRCERDGVAALQLAPIRRDADTKDVPFGVGRVVGRGGVHDPGPR